MSKERKLLEKVAVQLSVFDLKKASDLVDEIKELLAQPEQNNTQYLLDQVSILTAENAMLKEKRLSKGDDEDEYINEESGYNRSDWWE